MGTRSHLAQGQMGTLKRYQKAQCSHVLTVLTQNIKVQKFFGKIKNAKYRGYNGNNGNIIYYILLLILIIIVKKCSHGVLTVLIMVYIHWFFFLKDGLVFSQENQCIREFSMSREMNPNRNKTGNVIAVMIRLIIVSGRILLISSLNTDLKYRML